METNDFMEGVKRLPLVRIIRKSNIGIIIWLIFNIIILELLFGNDPTTHPFIAFMRPIILYGISLVIALSPIGEAILRLQVGAKKIRRKEHVERLKPLWEEVYSQAKQKDPSLSDNIKLFMSNNQAMNAFATGQQTIVVHKGLLKLSDEHIKATLAHEFGHISNKDTDIILVVGVGNLIISAIFIIYQIFAAIVAIVFGLMGEYRELISTILINIILAGAMWLWTKIGLLCVNNSMRANEFLADQFAFKLGYGNELIATLDIIDSNSEEMEEKGLFAALMSTH
ncbi:M48 family metalloprotease, partial [Aerococcus urinae]|uniref:M48 family metalloprotease n=1 Tax=Aerococcus urinae TaxID=1376 RepID=UPI00254C99D2